jgi:hypothetical protein
LMILLRPRFCKFRWAEVEEMISPPSRMLNMVFTLCDQPITWLDRRRLWTDVVWQIGDYNDTSAEEKMWKKLWNIKAPGKMKITLWRLAQECILSGFQLRQRNIPADDSCNIGMQSSHEFIACPQIVSANYG